MGKQYLTPDGHLSYSGILECMKRCGKRKNCCMGCPGRKGQLYGCAVDLEEEIILWFETYGTRIERHLERKRLRQAKKKAETGE